MVIAERDISAPRRNLLAAVVVPRFVVSPEFAFARLRMAIRLPPGTPATQEMV